MSVTAHQYPKINENMAKKLVDLTSDTLKVLALTAYTFSAAHSTLADVLGAGTEVGTSGTGYSAGGITLSGVSLSTTGSVTTLTATSPTIVVPAAGSLALAYLVFVDAQGGANTTRYPIAYVDFGGTVTYNDTGAGTETVTLAIPAGGITFWTAS